MSLTTFAFPTRTRFGPGALNDLPEALTQLGVRRPLVVTDAGLVKTEAFSALSRVLGDSRRNQDWFVFAEVQPNPTEDDVRRPAALFRQQGCDGVIAIGGGSPLDAGKAARLLVKHPEFPLAKFYEQTMNWTNLAPLVAIPTTAGTGSEVGRSSVITLDSTKRKACLFHPELLAKLVILDPELTIGLPPKLTAATGADALTHCIESFTCPVFHPMCDGIALEGIRLVVEALPKAFRDGRDIEARGKMLVAAAMGAVAFQKDLGAVHSLAHPLSTICGLHHGLANALCLVAVMNFNARRKPGLYRRVGLACGLDVVKVTDGEADCQTVGFITRFLADLGLNTKLREHGVKAEHLDALVAQAWEDPCHRTNAVPVTAEDLRALYLECL
ncbi:MAG TPA: iron-containing alcohol dehydrogenase [Verrucomicrobiota bacterium]|nr:iron-containing alcohol dehydrogenase [Verrucomicrobiota bacterium]